VGTQEQLNRMANVLFEQIWIEDSRVIEVKPRDELKTFFQLSFEEHLEKSIWRPRGALDSRVQTAYNVELLCPKINEICISPKKLSSLQQTEIIQKIGKKGLRELAREYDVSYETVRKIITRD
jgi:hypothetical protein